MVVKFHKKLSEYLYILMFDLASRNTGVCLWDIAADAPVFTTTIAVRSGAELAVEDLYHQLEGLFARLKDMGINKNSILISKEAMPTQVRHKSSTIQTFVALARSHAILDLFATLNGVDVYDYTGVYPISTHSYLKKIGDFEKEHKIEKQDIKNYVVLHYNISKFLTMDEYDAVFLAQTLVQVKWNRDLQEEIRAVRRHSRELKTAGGVARCQKTEAALRELLIPGGVISEQ